MSKLTRVFTKPYTTTKEQLRMLKERGFSVRDDEEVLDKLLKIGYYRLSSYWFTLEVKDNDGNRSHVFKTGATFDDVMRLYVFDQKLRLLVMEAMERIEICIRSVWAHKLSELYGSHPHLEKALFKNTSEYEESPALLQKDIQLSQSMSTEIRHYYESYAVPQTPPIWMITSCLNFGELIRWVRNTKNTRVKLSISRVLGLPNISVFEGTMRNLQTLRNISAHHNRLWDRRFTTRLPYIEKGLPSPMMEDSRCAGKGKHADNRLYNELLILSHIMLKLNADSTWPKRAKTLVLNTLTEEELASCGFPPIRSKAKI